MAQKTITFSSNAWGVRVEPGTRLTWAPTIGAGSMLGAVDSDQAVCQNTSGVARDSNSLDAKDFKEISTFPVFESDARNPKLTVRCNMGTGDGKDAGPFIYLFDSANMGNNEAMGPFDTVNAKGWYSRVSQWPSQAGNNIFTALAAGRFTVACIFPSRPADGGSIDFRWDAVALDLSYTYGPNTTPNPFDFQDKAGAVGTQVLSDALVITGIDVPQVVSISGDASAVFSVNGDAFSAVARNIAAGQTLQLRMTAPGVVGNAVNCTVSVESRSDAWKVTAGTDVPTTTLGAPADLINCIPGWLVPDAAVVVGQTFRYAPRGNTIPMPFSLAWSGVTQVQYSTTGTAGPWKDASIPGTLPVNSNIDIRCLAPSGPAQTGTVTLTYSSTNLTDTTNVSTGALGTIYKVDLSPIDAFEALGPSSTLHWSPTPSGAMHHASVATVSLVDGVSNSTRYTYINAGRWWRRADTSLMPWPVGSVLKGVDFGGTRSQSYPLAGGITSNMYARNPADTAWAVMQGSDVAHSNNQLVFMNGGASPGVTPTGWTLAQLFDAINADTFQMGRRTQLADSSGQIPNVQVRTHVLRVFFEVTKPPEGAAWEI